MIESSTSHRCILFVPRFNYDIQIISIIIVIVVVVVDRIVLRSTVCIVSLQKSFTFSLVSVIAFLSFYPLTLVYFVL